MSKVPGICEKNAFTGEQDALHSFQKILLITFATSAIFIIVYFPDFQRDLVNRNLTIHRWISNGVI